MNRGNVSEAVKKSGASVEREYLRSFRTAVFEIVL
jgi:hypothetical protein